MNDRHPPEDPYPPAAASDAEYAPYAPYDAQGVQFGDGTYTGYDGYDAYATTSVATSTAAFVGDGGYGADSLADGSVTAGGFTASAETGGFATGSFAPGAFAGVTDYENDPLFGNLPGSTPTTGDGYDTGQWYAATSADSGPHTAPGHDPYGDRQHDYSTGDYGASGYDAAHDTGSHSAAAAYDGSGQWDATAWAQLSQNPLDQYDQWGTDSYPARTAEQFTTSDPAAPGFEQQHTEAVGYETGGFAAAGYDARAHQPDGYAAADGHAAHGYATSSYPPDGYRSQSLDPLGLDPLALDTPAYQQHLEADPYGAQPFDAAGSPAFANTDLASAGHAPAEPLGDHTDPQAFASPAAAPLGTLEPELAGYAHEQADRDPAAAFGDPALGADETGYEDAYEDEGRYEDEAEHAAPAGHEAAGPTGADPQGDDPGQGRMTTPRTRRAPARPTRSSGSRTRRRSPAKRSALLTVAVPSVCVMGVAGIAAASVGGGGGDDKQTTASAADTQVVKPSVANNKLDTQLDNLSADTRDFADRASRTQERIDLEAKQEAERKKAAEEAARKERLRPKFALPVAQHGLSAYYGQAGVNWMSVHTGIDFPVAYGTQVMAATDGVVQMKYNTAYGNMAIVIAKDGTETWYCHLSSYKLSPGTIVKAGDVIAFSGNSGNSTGPHLHFEVRPGGGSAIDPLPWLRSHGLDPT